MVLTEEISRLEKQVRELGEALEIVKTPPKVKIDETAYPALNAVKKVWEEADARGQQQEVLKQLEDNLATQRTELARLKSIQNQKQQRINQLKRRQAAILERYEELANSATVEIQKLIGLSQLIVDAGEGLNKNPADVLGTFHNDFADQQLQVQLVDGKVCFSPKPRGLKVPSNNGFGSMTLGNFRPLVHQGEE
jgi:DNA repair exonuclease SbcCD ATPase subunit